MSFGVDPRNPLEYAKNPYFLMPCVTYPRAPISGIGGDYNFPINTVWRVGNAENGSAPTTGAVGDQWMLVTKTGGYAQGNINPSWEQIAFAGGSPSMLDKIGVDAALAPGTNPIVANGSGQVNILGNITTPQSIPVRTYSTVANQTFVQLQTTTSSTFAAKTINNAGMASFDSAAFTINAATGFVQLAGGGTALIQATPDTGTSPVVPNGSGNMNFTNTALFATGTSATAIRSNGTGANTLAYQLQLAGSNAATATANNFGVAQFDANQFTVTSGFVQISNFINYVQKATADSPYTAAAADYFISCNSTAGAMTINLPNAPTTLRRFVIKDRVGTSSANNITITTPGGVVTIDGATTYKLASNYSAVDLIFNGTSYEVF